MAPGRIVVGALVLAASGAGWAQVPAWRISETAGDVRIIHEGRSRPATRGALLSSGATIATAASARAVLVRGGEFVIVSPNSRLRVADPVQQRGGLVQMLTDFGTALFRSERRATPHFSVLTPHLAATVKGTVFTVTVGPAGGSVQVTEGAVEVSTLDGRAVQLLRPGMIATVTATNPNQIQVHGQTSSVIGSPGTAASAGAEPTAVNAAPTAIIAAPIGVAVPGSLRLAYVLRASDMVVAPSSAATDPVAPLSAAADALAAPVLATADPLVGPVLALVDPLLAPVLAVADPLLAPVELGAGAVIEPVAVLADAVEPVVGAVVAPLEAVTDPLVEGVLAPLDPVTDPVLAVAEPILDPIVDAVVEPVLAVAEPVVDPLVEAVEPLVDPAVELLDPVIEPLAEPVLEPVVEPVLDPLAPVLEPLAPILEPITAPEPEAEPEGSDSDGGGICVLGLCLGGDD